MSAEAAPGPEPVKNKRRGGRYPKQNFQQGEATGNASTSRQSPEKFIRRPRPPKQNDRGPRSPESYRQKPYNRRPDGPHSRNNREELTEKFSELNVNAAIFQPRRYNPPRHSNQRYSQTPRKQKPNGAEKSESKAQKESLEEQLVRGTYDCVICCGRVRSLERIWNCQSCFHIYHLTCVAEWAQKSISIENPTWRCPACQNELNVLPAEYRCFCGKQRNPQNKEALPHSCTELCGKPRSCPHKCNKLCHPGRCPSCEVIVKKLCNCGHESRQLRCDSKIVIKCERVCGKRLSCGKHDCSVVCHSGECEKCTEIKTIQCLCGRRKEEVKCDSEDTFHCEEACGLLLECGNHKCSKVCHSGVCGECTLAGRKTCPCGQKPLPNDWDCSKPIPLCDAVCDRFLECQHRCPEKCHEGPCPPCPVPIKSRRCRCDRIVEEAPCGQPVVLCKRRCNKKKTCCRHKCLDECCDKDYHICELVCGKKLSCQLHKCTNLCHGRTCPKCDNVSFSELSCHCGSSIIYPPIACNTKPPECSNLCSRQHNCDHPVTHPCHSDAACPPCTALVKKICNGGHKTRNNIPCYLENVSCGSPCDRPLPCTRHNCDKVCHSGACPTSCIQPCSRQRDCGHLCKLPCHEVCPRSICFSQVTITCECGVQTGQKVCHEFQQSVNGQIQQRLRRGDEINTSNGILTYAKGYLRCNEECALKLRQRQLAEAFKIDPSAPSTFVASIYSDFVKDEAKKNWAFASKIVQKLNELVEIAGMSSQPSRSHSFEPMHRDQRRFIYELIEAYKCTGKSYDAEPKRNVVVTAYKDKSIIPVTSLESFIGLKRPIPVWKI